ncbi:MAG TPA: leucine-rich repeat protein [Clostridia bacterium]|jgi:hypothetical protein|nr:leucine-rich repeat protein [Clostridia bacterium]
MKRNLDLKAMYEKHASTYQKIMGKIKGRNVEYYTANSEDWNEVLEKVGFFKTDNIEAVIAHKGSRPLVIQMKETCEDIEQALLPSIGDILSFSGIKAKFDGNELSFMVNYNIYENLVFFDEIAFYIFRGDYKLDEEDGVYYTKDGFVYIKDLGRASALGYVYIPEGVKCIVDYAFFGSSSLEFVIIPSSVERIGSAAFLNCYSLNAIFYEGTKEEWDQVTISQDGTRDFDEAKLYYYSETEPPLNSSGTDYGDNYWRYSEKPHRHKNIAIDIMLEDMPIEVWEK